MRNLLLLKNRASQQFHRLEKDLNTLARSTIKRLGDGDVSVRDVKINFPDIQLLLYSDSPQMKSNPEAFILAKFAELRINARVEKATKTGSGLSFIVTFSIRG